MRRTGVLVALALAACAVLAAPAGAAQRLVTITTPSKNVDPNKVEFNGADHAPELRANVLLPDGYSKARRYPVLFLLHGVGDAYDGWANPKNGDILSTARGFKGIIVMPEAARGFYTNWWNDGRRGDPGWERYYLDELVPLVEKRFSIRRGRRWHAIAGLSMGGLGATFLASQLPGYFGASATFSGFVSHQRTEIPPALTLIAQADYQKIFGPPEAFYATGHNPSKLTDNLRSTRLYITVGDGTPRPGVQSEPAAIAGGGLIEAGLRPQSEELDAAARASGVDVTFVQRQGVHDWPYWREHLRDAITWGFFKPVDESPSRWTYRTVAQRGVMWGLSFTFSAPPGEVERFDLAGERLTGAGSGTVSIRTAAGCEFTASLPFARMLPRGCAATRPVAIAARVSPRRVRAGRRTRFRLRASTPTGPLLGATIRFAGRALRTNRAGRASVVARLRAGRYRARFTRAGLRSATVTVTAAAGPRFTG